eukprot:Colp12_sorted_trinity150504_noHs@17526
MVEVLIAQGAEARVYTSQLMGKPCIVKERFPKTYRHPELDAKLTRSRVSQEARCIGRCRKSGVGVPVLYFVDPEASRIYMELIPGPTMKQVLLESVHNNGSVFDQTLANKIGLALGKMHDCDVVHGDLTTSNMVLRSTDNALVLIDFGLSQVSTLVEDKAVDLYVLERAFTSTHPQLDNMFAAVLVTYSKQWKGAGQVLKKLDEVRMRGRKKSMVG